MEWFQNGWGVSLATFLPMAGVVAMLFIPSTQDRLIKLVGTLFAGLTLVAGILLLFQFDYGSAGTL